jgi:hypothetical protein
MDETTMNEKQNNLDDLIPYEGIASQILNQDRLDQVNPLWLTCTHENLYQLSDMQIDPETGQIRICSNPTKNRYDTVSESLGRDSSITNQVTTSMNLLDSIKIEDIPLTASVSPSLPLTTDFICKTLEGSLQDTHILGLGISSISIHGDAYPISIQLDGEIQPISGLHIDKMGFSTLDNQLSLDSGLSKMQEDLFDFSTQTNELDGIITSPKDDELGKIVISSNVPTTDRDLSIEYFVGQKYYDSSICEKPIDCYYRDNPHVGDLLSAQYAIRRLSFIDENGLLKTENYQPSVSIHKATLKQIQDSEFTLYGNSDQFLIKRMDYKELLKYNQSLNYDNLSVIDSGSDIILTASVSQSLLMITDLICKTLEGPFQDTHTLGLGTSSISICDYAYPSFIQLDTPIQPYSRLCVEEMRLFTLENQVSLDSSLSRMQEDLFDFSTQTNELDGIITSPKDDELDLFTIPSMAISPFSKATITPKYSEICINRERIFSRAMNLDLSMASYYLTRVDRAKTNKEKKDSMEEFAEYLFSCVNGFKVLPSKRTSIVEIDRYVENNRSDHPLFNWIGMKFIVEAKNWFKKVGTKEVIHFARNVEYTGCNLGVMVTKSGITGEGYKDAQGVIRREYDRLGIVIVVLDYNDLRCIADGSNLLELLYDRINQVHFF